MGSKKNPPPNHRRRKGGGVLLCAEARRDLLLASIRGEPATHAELVARFPKWHKSTVYLDLQVLQARGLIVHEKYGALWKCPAVSLEEPEIVPVESGEPVEQTVTA